MQPNLMNFIEISAEIFFYVLLLIFSIHSVILAYHWFSYGTSRATNLIMLAAYLGGGAIFFLIMAMSMNAF